MLPVLLLAACTVQANTKLTFEMLKHEDEVCSNGTPTKEDLKELLSNSTYIDNQIATMPDAYRVILEEGARQKGITLREALIDDASNVAANKWLEVCSKRG
jgi:hypothetical protein